MVLLSRKAGGINLKNIIGKALYRGDELHNRPDAGSSMFANMIITNLIETGMDHNELLPVAKHLDPAMKYFSSV